MRKGSIILFSAIGIIFIFYLFTIREGQQWGDFSHYIQHAKNIVDHRSYGSTGYIFNPSLPWVGPKSYPPVLPLILAPIYKFWGLNLRAMKVEIIIFFVLTLVIISFLFKENIKFWYLLSVIFLIGFNPYFWNFKENIVSDIPFLFFSHLCLYEIRKAYESKQFNTLNALAIGFFLYLSFGTRVIGIVLFVVIIIYDILQSKHPSLFLLKVIVLASALVSVQQIIIKTFPTYSEEFYFSFGVIIKNLISYGRALCLLLSNGYFVVGAIILSSLFLGLAIFGYIKRVSGGVTIFELYLPIYAAAIGVWPRCQGERYLIPLIPLYLFYTFVGLEKATNKDATRKALFYILIIGSCISYIGMYTRMDYRHIDGVTNKECVGLFNYIKENSDSTDVFVFTRPRVLALYTERRSALFPYEWEDEEIWRYLKGINASHIIVGGGQFAIGRVKAFGIDQNCIFPFIKRHEDRFCLIYNNPGFKVYKIK